MGTGIKWQKGFYSIIPNTQQTNRIFKSIPLSDSNFYQYYILKLNNQQLFGPNLGLIF